MSNKARQSSHFCSSNNSTQVPLKCVLAVFWVTTVTDTQKDTGQTGRAQRGMLDVTLKTTGGGPDTQRCQQTQQLTRFDHESRSHDRHTISQPHRPPLPTAAQSPRGMSLCRISTDLYPHPCTPQPRRSAGGCRWSSSLRRCPNSLNKRPHSERRVYRTRKI